MLPLLVDRHLTGAVPTALAAGQGVGAGAGAGHAAAGQPPRLPARPLPHHVLGPGRRPLHLSAVREKRGRIGCRIMCAGCGWYVMHSRNVPLAEPCYSHCAVHDACMPTCDLHGVQHMLSRWCAPGLQMRQAAARRGGGAEPAAPGPQVRKCIGCWASGSWFCVRLLFPRIRWVWRCLAGSRVPACSWGCGAASHALSSPATSSLPCHIITPCHLAPPATRSDFSVNARRNERFMLELSRAVQEGQLGEGECVEGYAAGATIG